MQQPTSTHANRANWVYSMYVRWITAAGITANRAGKMCTHLLLGTGKIQHLHTTMIIKLLYCMMHPSRSDLDTSPYRYMYVGFETHGVIIIPCRKQMLKDTNFFSFFNRDFFYRCDEINST